MRTRTLLVGLLLTSVTTPSAAAAATAGVFSTEGGQGGESFVFDTASYRAAPGERNELRVSLEREGFREDIVFSDPGATIAPGEGCESTTAHMVRCSGPFNGDVRAVASLGDLDDAVDLEAGSRVDAGPGDDTIQGSPARDRLEGGLGTDLVRGGGRPDSLSDLGGDGDVLDGQAGVDGLDLRNRLEGARVDLGSDMTRLVGEIDAIPNIENVTSGRGDDVLIGDSANNELRSFAGRDTIVGGDGADFLNCKSPIRRRCRLHGGAAGDLLFGSAGPDVLTGDGDEDSLYAGPGRDRLVGGRGRDLLDGGQGPDVLAARDGQRDRLRGGRGSDRARADRRGDSLRSVERLF